MFNAVLFALLIALPVSIRATGCSTPRFKVIGGVYIDNDKAHYFRGGDSVEVFCSSDSSNQLEIFVAAKKLHSDIINSTTIRTVIEVSSSYSAFLECRNTCNSESRSTYTRITGDYYPEINNFDCFSDNFELLHCGWSTPNNKGNYSLSYLRPDGTIILQACRRSMWYKLSYSCTFDLSNLENTGKDDPHVNLQLEICNYFGCLNQTRDFSLLEITKLAPPTDLGMRYFTDAYGERTIFFSMKAFRNEIVFKMEIYFAIEYWFPGIEPRVITNKTHLFYRRVNTNHIVNLPCPDKQYTLRVSCRAAGAPSAFMSDYAYVFFHTDPDPEAKALDPICKVRPVVETPPVMVYKTQLLGKYIDGEIENLKNLKKPLEDNAAVIRKLQAK